MKNLVFLNQTELAKRWMLSPRTLERWRWLGTGPRYHKIGGKIAYKIKDIEQFEQSCFVKKEGASS